LLSAVSANAQFTPRAMPFKYNANWNPAWESLVPIARSTAAQIKGGAVGPDVIRPLREAQVSLSAPVPRPIICLDMMVDAMSKRRIDPAYAIKRADEAVECYEGGGWPRDRLRVHRQDHPDRRHQDRDRTTPRKSRYRPKEVKHVINTVVIFMMQQRLSHRRTCL
jgi:hypothetical protein